MKFFILLLFFCSISTLKKSSDNLIFKRFLEVDPPRPELLKKFPISISIKKQELTLCLLEYVGIALVTIANESNQVVTESVIDSMTQRTHVVSMSTWRGGPYTIYITYNTTTLHGKFVL